MAFDASRPWIGAVRMKFYTDTDEALTLTALLCSMGHRLHTTQVQGKLERAARDVGCVPFVRCRTLWQPALDMAAAHGGSGAAHAAICLAMEGVDVVLATEGFALTVAAVQGIPVFAPDDMGVLAL